MTTNKDSKEDPKVVRGAQDQPWDSQESRDRAEPEDLTMDQRIALLRDEYSGDILPDVNVVPGRDPEMHYFWASTTNQTDAVYRRQRLGYVLVKSTELPTLAAEYAVKTGQFEGCISVNEMILMKIPQVLFKELMKINHHERPLEQEQRIQEEAAPRAADREGRELGKFDDEDEGFKHIVHDRRAPKHW